MHLLKYHWPKIQRIALRNRQEILRAGLTRRDLFKLGLLSSSGYLVAKVGLSAWASHNNGTNCSAGDCRLGCSPPTTPFVDPLPILQQLPLRDPNTDPGFTFSPPTATPNRNINPATGIPFEGRTQVHQFRDRFPAEEFFITRMRPNFNATFSDHPSNLANIGPQLIWGFNLGGTDASDVGRSPGPIIVSRYGNPILIRRFNELTTETLGFGVPEVSTHHHNFHSGPDSDGGPCDPTTGGFSTNPLVQGRFFFIGQFYDYFHTLAQAGFDTPQFTATDGDIRETLTTLWYHDHRVDHTAENTYKGLVGNSFIFNDFDTGDESTGFRFPSFPQFDIPLTLADKLFTPEGELCFDTFDFDGLVGDKFLVNGKIQPFFEVQKRRYRFRILDVGPSRFYRLFLVNPANPTVSIPFTAITTTDGNLLPRPIRISGPAPAQQGVVVSVAERIDVIVDFKKIWQQFGSPSGVLNIRLENRLQQDNGRGPDDLNDLDPPGLDKNGLVEFRIMGPDNVADGSFDYAAIAFPDVPCSPTDCVFTPICLPNLPTDNNPVKEDDIRITRTFRFERENGQWAINGEFVDCTQFRFAIERNTAERWILENGGGGWSHPIHIHLEELRMITRNAGSGGSTGGGGQIVCGDLEFGRKDVVRLDPNDEVEIVMRFRDFLGGWPMHCHNTVHEDHAMMLLWQVANTGDNKTEP